MYVKGKVALITGSASGLGLVYAKELLKNGAKAVTLTDVNAAQGEKALAEVTKMFGAKKAIFLKLDVVDKKEFESAIKKTVETFGNFDILINNAGIMNDSIWEKQVDINIKGVVNGCILAHEEYLPKYKSESSEPTIVNIASIAAINPCPGLPVYGATKAGVVSLGKSLAAADNYDAKKVRVLTMCPGLTWTPLLDGVDQKSYTPRHNKSVHDVLKSNPGMPEQTPEQMGASMIKMIENGANGSVWVAQDGNLYEVDVPNQPDLKIVRQI